MDKISVVIITQEEEAAIKDAITSVRTVSDDIVVVDDYSKDSTAKIAKQQGAQVFLKKFENYAKQKAFGISKTKHSWVLILDADERLSPKLAASIAAARPSSSQAAYEFAFRNFLGSAWLRHGGLYPDFHARLFNKSKASFGPRAVHEELILQGPTKALAGDVIHYTYKDAAEYRDKVKKYSRWQAEEDSRLGRARAKNAAYMTVREFLKRYLYMLGILDGVPGLINAVCLAEYQWLYYQRLRESRR